MRRGPKTDCGDGISVPQQARTRATSAIDLGLTLSVYGKHKDGSLFEIGNPASPLARQSAAGTWPTEQ